MFWFFVRQLRNVSTNKHCYPLARYNLAGLVSNLTSDAINKFDRKTSGKRAVRVGKGFTLFIYCK